MTALAWFVGTLVAAVAGFALLVLMRFADWAYESSRLGKVIIRMVIFVLVIVAGWFFGLAIFGGPK